MQVECELCGDEHAELYPRSGVVGCRKCRAHYIPQASLSAPRPPWEPVDCSNCRYNAAYHFPGKAMTICPRCGLIETGVVANKPMGPPLAPQASPGLSSPAPREAPPKGACPYCHAKPHKESCGLWSPYSGEHA
jgi:hypothetical protein